MGRSHLVLAGEVEPDLEELERVGLLAVEEREHLGVDDAFAGRQPLHVAGAEAGRGAERVGVIDEAAPHDGHRLEAAVGVLREPGHHGAVVHAKPVLDGEVLPEVAPRERRRGAEALVAGRVGVVVVDAEEKGIGRLPGEPERANVEHGVVHEPSIARDPRPALAEDHRASL